METETSDVQLENVPYPIEVRPSAMDTVVSAEQPSKHALREVTLPGMVADFSAVQLLNARTPIVVTFSGMETEVRDAQPLKAYVAMEVTLSGMVTEVSAEHPENACSSIFVTLPGTVTVVSALQP